MSHPPDLRSGLQSAQIGLLINAALAVLKLIAGVLGNSYALIADAVESISDIFSSLIVFVGLHVAGREPDEDFPFGYGRAESLAAAVVSLMLIGTAIGISIESIREIQTPHHAPAAWTLGVLLLVVVVKWFVSRKVNATGAELGSRSLQADAWHHLSDALTSATAFVGISLAVVMGPGWEAADDWAALTASAIILFNGGLLLKGALSDLMDHAPDPEINTRVRRISEQVPGVRAIEKLIVRRAGLRYFIEIHVQADGSLPLAAAHALGGHVKAEIRRELPSVANVTVHLEPFDPGPGSSSISH